MATTTAQKNRARKLWLQVHKWIGLLLAVLIVPISVTGAALVWHDWLDAQLNPQRHSVAGPPQLEPADYAASASAALRPGERIATITLPDEEGPVTVSAWRPPEPGAGRPVRTSLWLDPASGRLLDRAASNEGAVRVLHVLHGSLMVPGVGRQIVGWVGVAMLMSCLTGLWLWWPVKGGFVRGLRWRRRNSSNANLHFQSGFWIAIPLAMLSFTGVWISFPQFFSQFTESASGRQAGGDRMSRLRAAPLEAPSLDATAAVAAAQPFATGRLMSIGWPTDQAAEWRVSFSREGSPAEVKVSDTTGEATSPPPPRPETFARTMRRWHDGTGMGPVWQTVIFIGGIIPALLAVTGILIWLRTRRRRGDHQRRRENGLALEAAE
jgi:uncharacterized iron-regulated membrane protein